MLRRTFLKLLAAVGVGTAVEALPAIPVKTKRVARQSPCLLDGSAASVTITITGVGTSALREFTGKVNDAAFELNGNYVLEIPDGANVKVGDVLHSVGPIQMTWTIT